MRFLQLIAAVACLLSAGACETSFDPYLETDQYYSIFGALDASAERQWIRVEAPQDGRLYGADSTLDVEVRLEHIESNRQSILDDSLFEVSSGTVVHNFHTDMPLQTGGTYRLTVRDGDGDASQVEVRLPHALPEIDGEKVEEGIFLEVDADSRDRVVVLKATYDIKLVISSPKGPIEHMETVEEFHADRLRSTSNGYRANFNWVGDLEGHQEVGARVVPLTLDVTVVTAGPDWPSYAGKTLEELLRPGVAPSNVKNGYGYLAGAASDTMSITFAPSDAALLLQEAGSGTD